jgi:hypothetical protein
MSIKRIAASTILLGILTPILLALSAWAGNSIVEHGKQIRANETNIERLLETASRIDNNVQKLLER